MVILISIQLYTNNRLTNIKKICINTKLFCSLSKYVAHTSTLMRNINSFYLSFECKRQTRILVLTRVTAVLILNATRRVQLKLKLIASLWALTVSTWTSFTFIFMRIHSTVEERYPSFLISRLLYLHCGF